MKTKFIIVGLFLAAIICFAQASAQSVGGSFVFQGSFGPVAIGTPQGLSQAICSGGSCTGTTLALTTTRNINNGDLVVVCSLTSASSALTTTGVSDGTNSYTQVAAVNYFSHGNLSLWYKANASAVSSGASITATYSGTGTSTGSIMAFRVSGLLTSPLDKSNTGTGSGTTLSVATGTLSKANEIVTDCAGSNSTASTYTQSSGFTNMQANGFGGGPTNSLDQEIVAATTTVTVAPTWGPSQTALGLIVASFEGN